MSLDPAQRAGLERARAVALAREQFELDASADDVEVDAAPFGVTVHSSTRAVVVVSSDDLAVLGGVLVWRQRHPDVDVDVVVEHHAGTHARRVDMVAPEMTVWSLGSQGAPSVLAVTPDVLPEPHPTTPGTASIVAMIKRCGASIVVEDGIVRAEVMGLEVGRVVESASGPTLEVGVGRFDREAGVLLHAGRDIEETLADVIGRVAKHRQEGVPAHAINRLARERWLREVILNDPGLARISAASLVEPIPPRSNLLDACPAALFGKDGEADVLVVCTVGADLGVVPAVADLIMRHRPDLVRIVLPQRDVLPHLQQLVTRLGVPTELLGIDPPWQN
ncbi:MAG: hypothetical protein P8L46_04725 [Acidimicrobiales bacterium]|nr:hypothetical protein [Acidimicrobiales bacterium]MDG2217329.1 hypothetical protein [Acidimicrobiales bacterium]